MSENIKIIIWSVITEMVGPELIDNVIKETATLTTEDLFSDGVLK